MAQIWMDVDIALSEVPVNIQALIDDTDFKTREESVAYDQAGMDLVWNFVTTAGAYTQTAVTPTTSGDYDWASQGNGMYSIEIPASGGASINNDTEGFGWFAGFATGVLPWRGPIIGFRAAGLNDKLVDSAYSATRALAGTALPDAASNAAGGLPVSAAGSLALDTQLANTNEVTAARMGALTDWINGGRLDLILDEVLADVTGINGDAMRGTNSAALAATALTDVTWTAAMAQALTDWIDGGRLDLILDAVLADVTGINGDAMRGTDSAALAATALSTAVWTAARAGALTDWLDGERLDLILDAVLADVTGINGDAMRGTDGANTTVPDAAGVAPTANEIRDAILDDATRFSGANVDAAISSRSSHSAADVWTSTTRTLSSFGTLVADIATAVWGAVTRTLTSGGDATEAKQNTIIADIAAQNDVSTAQVQSSCDSAVSANASIVAIKAKTDNQPAGVKKNVALNDFVFEMVLDSDHITPATGLTVTCQIIKDGAAYVNSTNSVSEISAGSYKISFTQAEMNFGILAWKFTAPTADQKVVAVITSA